MLALAPIRKQYRKGLLFIDKKGGFGAISVTERSCTAPLMNVDGHTSDRFLPASSQCVGLIQWPLPLIVFNFSWGDEIENNAFAEFWRKRPNWTVSEVNEWE